MACIRTSVSPPREGFPILMSRFSPFLHRVEQYSKYKPKMRRHIGSTAGSINPDAAVFTRKLVTSIEQRIMLEKVLMSNSDE